MKTNYSKYTFLIMLASLLSIALNSSFIFAAEDEMTEEIKSTISSDPEMRNKAAKPAAAAPAKAPETKPSAAPSAPAPKPTVNTPSEEEWKTMESEKTKTSAKKHAVGLSSIKFDLEQNKIIITPKINFASNSDSPTAESMQSLKKLAQELIKKAGVAVRIEGHTDSIGYDQPNMELSQKRADRVKEVLVQGGVAADRIQAIGMGDKYPVASSSTPEGQEKNRRVEFHITGLNPAAKAPEAPKTTP